MQRLTCDENQHVINAGDNKLTRAGANQLVNRLVDIGLLREITGYARNRRFRFEPYLRLFEEPEEGEA
jgi:hypothetical protein